MSIRRVQPDPYVIIDLSPTHYRLKVTPYTVNELTVELFNGEVRKLDFRMTLDDIKQLARESERLVADKVHELQRQKFSMDIILWSDERWPS